MIPAHRWIPPRFWSRPSHYRCRRNRRWCSLALRSALKSCRRSLANVRQSCWTRMNEEKEWLNEWTDEIETVMTNRAACVSTEGELPRDDYLGEKGQKEHNGAPVQVKFTPCAEPHFSLCCFSSAMQKTEKRTGDIWGFVCLLHGSAKTDKNHFSP